MAQNDRSEALSGRPAGKRLQGHFSGRWSSGPETASELPKTTVLRPFPAALQGSVSRAIFPAGAAAARKHRQNGSNLRFGCPFRPPCGEAAETLPKPACKLAEWSFMAGLSLSLWVLQPLVAGRFLGLSGMRVVYTIV